MFTVLIAEQQHIDAIQQKNSLFFEPFLGNKELAFCAWNPEGQTLREAVPGLCDAVGRRTQWRVVLIHNGTEAQCRQQNPFDLIDGSPLLALERPAPQPTDGEAWDQWEARWEAYYRDLTPLKEALFRRALALPLQRLANWLCFRPADYVLEDVAERKDVDDWAKEVLGDEALKPGARLEAMERSQYRLELRMKEQLRRGAVEGHSLDIAYPSEFHCISPRITENGFFHPETYWNIRLDLEYSTFADRNMYYDRMRFMVFDILPKTHANYRSDQIRFLFAAMVFATNPTPGSAMQARRLYLLESENDDRPLCVLASSFEKKLTSTFDVIGTEIDKIRSEIPGELTDREAEALFCSPADVPVTLDKSCDTEALTVDTVFGLSSDCPEEESGVWRAGYAAAEKSLAYIVRQQSRSVRRSVEKVPSLSEVDSAQISRLTAFQMEDVRDYTEAAEDDMVASIPPDPSDLPRYRKPMEEQAAKVKRVLERRMRRKTTILMALLCLGLYLICFLPMLLNNAGSSSTVSTAIILIGATLGLIALILLITLFFLRVPLKSAVRDFNNQMTANLNDIRSSMQRFSHYLSAVCNARRGHAVLNYAEKNPDEYTRSIRIRRRHQEDIRRKRAYLLEGYRDFIFDRGCYDEAMIQPYDYDFSLKTEYAYPAPFLAGDFRQIEFLESGNFITVPSSYVTRMSVRMEGLYDK